MSRHIEQQNISDDLDQSMFPLVHIEELSDINTPSNLTHIRFNISHIQPQLDIVRIMIYQYQGIPNFVSNLANIQNLPIAVDLKVLDSTVAFLNIDRNILMYNSDESIYSFFTIFINSNNRILSTAQGPYIKQNHAIRLYGSGTIPGPAAIHPPHSISTITIQHDQINLYVSGSEPPITSANMLWLDITQPPVT